MNQVSESKLIKTYYNEIVYKYRPMKIGVFIIQSKEQDSHIYILGIFLFYFQTKLNLILKKISYVAFES